MYTNYFAWEIDPISYSKPNHIKLYTRYAGKQEALHLLWHNSDNSIFKPTREGVICTFMSGSGEVCTGLLEDFCAHTKDAPPSLHYMFCVYTPARSTKSEVSFSAFGDPCSVTIYTSDIESICFTGNMCSAFFCGELERALDLPNSLINFPFLLEPDFDNGEDYANSDYWLCTVRESVGVNGILDVLFNTNVANVEILNKIESLRNLSTNLVRLGALSRYINGAYKRIQNLSFPGKIKYQNREICYLSGTRYFRFRSDIYKLWEHLTTLNDTLVETTSEIKEFNSLLSVNLRAFNNSLLTNIVKLRYKDIEAAIKAITPIAVEQLKKINTAADIINVSNFHKNVFWRQYVFNILKTGIYKKESWMNNGINKVFNDV